MEFVEDHVGQVVVKHANLHVSWLATLAMQVPLGTTKDVLRHEHSDHVLERLMNDSMGIVVGVLMGMDLSACNVVGGCIVVLLASGVDLHVDSHLESAFKDATHALSVEHIHRSGIDNTQSGEGTIDILFPSKDRACVLSSLEVAHLELVLQ
jgi:hypothetical protein